RAPFAIRSAPSPSPRSALVFGPGTHERPGAIGEHRRRRSGMVRIEASTCEDEPDRLGRSRTPASRDAADRVRVLEPDAERPGGMGVGIRGDRPKSAPAALGRCAFASGDRRARQRTGWTKLRVARWNRRVPRAALQAVPPGVYAAPRTLSD